MDRRRVAGRASGGEPIGSSKIGDFSRLSVDKHLGKSDILLLKRLPGSPMAGALQTAGVLERAGVLGEGTVLVRAGVLETAGMLKPGVLKTS